MMVSYHVKTKGNERNVPGIVVVYYATDDRGTINRMLKHHGVHHTWVHVRQCSEEEFNAEYAPYHRIRSIKYTKYIDLINDELMYCKDEDHLLKLKQIKEQFNYIFHD